MKNSVLVCTVFSACFAAPIFGQGNRAASMEYLQSSSPLKTGGSVTAYSTPGNGVVTSISPDIGTSPSSIDTSRSVLQSPPADFTAATSRVAANPFPTGLPNPAASPPSVFDPYLTTAPATIQIPTLGFTQNNSYRPSLFRNPWGQPQPAPGLPPIDLPVASLAPQINTPGGGAVSAPALQLPSSNPVLLSGQNSAIRYQNMPPGVYYGKGILGQPKAYVDGQPARNLMRFIFP